MQGSEDSGQEVIKPIMTDLRPDSASLWLQ